MVWGGGTDGWVWMVCTRIVLYGWRDGACHSVLVHDPFTQAVEQSSFWNTACYTQYTETSARCNLRNVCTTLYINAQVLSVKSLLETRVQQAHPVFEVICFSCTTVTTAAVLVESDIFSNKENVFQKSARTLEKTSDEGSVAYYTVM